MKVILLLGVMAFGVLQGITASAQTQQELQDRMKARVPRLAQLKQAQIIGENRKGYVEIVKIPSEPAFISAAEIKNLVETENADRKQVYELVAEHTNASPEVVARIRAKQIYENANSNVPLKTRDGRWVTKATSEQQEQ